MTDWLARAKEFGFDAVAWLDPGKLEVRADVRAMCAANTCRAYGKNWTCPPACGSLEDCGLALKRYSKGILLQTVGHLEKTVDSRGYRETERRHLKHFSDFTRVMRQEYPNALCLGAGACRVCKVCAYPEPCRFPGEAISSMEAYGLFVTQVCRDCALPYHYGEKTVTYTACVLFESE